MINPEALKENLRHEIEASKKSGDEAFRCTYNVAEAIIEYIEQEITLKKSIECKISEILDYFTKDLKSLEELMCDDYFMYPTYELEAARRKARLEASFHLCSAIDKIFNGEKE